MHFILVIYLVVKILDFLICEWSDFRDNGRQFAKMITPVYNFISNIWVQVAHLTNT